MWLMALLACGLVSSPTEQTTTNAQKVPGLDPQSTAPIDKDFPSSLILDGTRVAVNWDDGDTFAVKPGEDGKSARARLNGFNTLESYGPVHQWGDWTFKELYAIAKQAGVRAASEEWTCTSLDGQGGYGRLLVDCPDLRLALISEGLAHNFAVEVATEPQYVTAQQAAVAAKVGMWEQGAPSDIVTSLHSTAENQKAGKPTYDRVVSVLTGEANKFEHEEAYEVCQRVCHGGSCMLYVPYENRYSGKLAECLKPNFNEAELTQRGGEASQQPPAGTPVEANGSDAATQERAP